MFGRNASPAVALDDVDLSIERCSTLALVGQSGSGKSTLAKCVVLLEAADAGEVIFEGSDILKARGEDLAAVRRGIQLLFQHSATALNPNFSAVQAVEEPLVIQKVKGRTERRMRALAMMERVEFPASWADRSSHELSGGQRQRLALARALVLEPELLILDEALAGLDLPLQAQIAETLRRLQAMLSLSYLFITHDLRMAAHLADEMAIIAGGRIVETGRPGDLFNRSQHAATRELIRTIPRVPATGESRTDALL